jgi:LacI family transcriptional regulator
MADVARAAGVSIKTVSRVVNDVPTVDPDLAERVRAASAALGFQRNDVAAMLRQGRTTATIGLVIKDISNSFYATIAAGAADVASRHDTHLITAHSGENPQDELQVIRDLCRRRVDGLIVVPTGGDHSTLREEIDRGTPMVFVDRVAEGLEADTVLVDNVEGARDGVAELLRGGHSRVAVIVDTLMMRTMGQRLEGAKAAFADARATFDEALVRTDIADPDAAYSAAREMLALDDPPTAFFCGNNRSATGVLQLLWEEGRDEALLAFDDFPLASLMPRPLTCVGYDNRALGTIAAELLFRRIAGEDFATRTVVLPTELVARGIADSLRPR